MSEITRQENQGKRVTTRQEMQQSGELQHQTIRRARRVMTNLGGDTAEKVFGSDNLFSRNNSDMSNKSGQQTEVEIKVDNKSSLGMRPDAMECKCAFREEEKRMLRELNDKHLKIISEKQSDIECLQQKLETLEQFRSSCVEEERRKLEESISILESKIYDMETERDDLRRSVFDKDHQIDALEHQKNDLENALARKEEKLLIIKELNEQISILKVNNDAAEEKIKWLQDQREREKANYEQSIKNEFNEKWETIITRIESGWGGGINFEEMKKTIEDFRASLDNSAEFKNFEAKFKEKLKYLEENLEKERETVKTFAGEKSELSCKLNDLEKELEIMKRENGDIRQRLSDEKCIQAKTISEMEEEIRQLKARLIEIKYSEWCINGGPVNLSAEIEMYGNLLNTREIYGRKGRKDSSSSSSSDGDQIDAKYKHSATRGISVSSMGQQSTRQTNGISSSSRSTQREVRKSQTKIN